MKRGGTKTRPAPAVRERAPALTHERVAAWVVPLVFAGAVLLLFHEFFLSGGWLLGTDTYALSYFAREFYTSVVEQTGRFPQWDPLLFGGLPFVDGMHGDIFYPPSLALFFMEPRAFWGWKMVLHVLLAGVLCYLWLRTLELRRGPALFGGLVFMMGADLVSLVYPGGDGKLFVSALAPLGFLLTERAVRHRRPSDFALFALGITLVVLTSHMQLAYFTVWGVSLYFLFRLWQVKREHGATAAGRAFAMFVVAGVLGVGAAAAQFVPPLQYLREWSHRADRTLEAEAGQGYEYSTTYALHPEEIASLVVPEFVGHDVQSAEPGSHAYWGRNEFKINSEYAGLVPLLLIPILFIGRREGRAWFFAALAALSLLYALGANTPLFRLFYMIPGVNLFRAPSLIIFLYGLSVATLGAMALQRMLDARSTGDGRFTLALWIGAGVLGVLALLQSAGTVTNLWLEIFDVPLQRHEVMQATVSRISAGFWIAFLIAVMVAGAWHVFASGIINRRMLVGVLCAIAFLDLYRADRPFIEGAVFTGAMQQRAQATLFSPDETIRFLQERQASGEVFRAYDVSRLAGAVVYGHNDLAAHGIEQLTGHHGNEIGRYRELVGGDDGLNVVRSEFRLLDLTNTAYVIAPGRLDPAQVPGLEEVFAGSRSIVYRRSSALPRAWLVGRVEVVSDENATGRLLSAEFDARNTVLLPDPLPGSIRIEPDPEGTVEWVERVYDDVLLRVNTDRPALLVLSDNFYPAWHATVDGEPVPVLRANYTFRAVPVPAGTHEVRFTYHSDVLAASAAVSAGLLALLLLIALVEPLRGMIVRGRADAEGKEKGSA